MNEFLDKASQMDMLEVIEGLLELCMQREAQIAELIMERERPWYKKLMGPRPHKDESESGGNGTIKRTDKQGREGILVVDDTEMMRLQLIQLFRSNGHKIIGSAINGSEAVEMYRKYKPALVTMDTDMPIMDGYEATRKIKEIDSDARVIIISHVLEKKMIVEAIRSGAMDYLVKPVQPNRLLKLVEEIYA
ncbi:MAG TPA: response regulator [Firmicutes bacterium]|nr:response regulator [Bacillota bacterium]